VVPVVLAVAGALACAALATRPVAFSRRDLTMAGAAAGCWALLAYAAPHLLTVDRTVHEQYGAVAIVVFAAAAALILVRALRAGPAALAAGLPLVAFALPGVRDHTKVALAFALAALACALALELGPEARQRRRGGRRVEGEGEGFEPSLQIHRRV
jgi:hypothetical protein